MAEYAAKTKKAASAFDALNPQVEETLQTRRAIGSAKGALPVLAKEKEQKEAKLSPITLRPLRRILPVRTTPLMVADVVKAPTPPMEELENAGLKLGAMMKHRWIKDYVRRTGADAKRAGEMLKRHWKAIVADVRTLSSHKPGGKFEYEGMVLWAPSADVPKADLAALVALSYFNQERCGLNAHFLQALMGKETNFRTWPDGDAGSGLLQFTAIGLAGVLERVKKIDEQLEKRGYAPLDGHIGQVRDRKGKWRALVEEEKTRTVGRRRHRYVEKYQVPVDFSQSLEGKTIVRARGFEKYMADPLNIIELASALLYVKGARPGMNRDMMNDAAMHYNGNTHPFNSPEGEREPVNVYYAKYVDTQTQLLERGQKKKNLASK